MYYEVLGAARGASDVELKRAYRRAVLAAHPDTGGDAAAFQAVQDAWAVLGDPVRRRAYDVRNPGGGAKPSAEARTAGASSGTATSATPSSAPPRPKSAASAGVAPESPAEADRPDLEDEPAAAPLQEDLQVRRWRPVTLLAIAAAVITGCLGGWVAYLMFGRVGLAAAGIYVVLTAGAVVNRRLGAGEMDRLLRRLLKACWAVTACWAAFGLLAALIGHEWATGAVWAAVFGVFGAAMTYLSGARTGTAQT